jgi:hypothetical protein
VETQQPAAVATAANQNPPSKNLVSSFSESHIQCKQGGGAAVLGEGHDTVTRDTCVPSSLNVNNSGEAVVMHFALF